MQIIIKDNLIKAAIKKRVKTEIFDYFDRATIKESKIPSKKELVEQLMADDKFQAGIARYLSDLIDDDVIYDAVEAADSKSLNKALDVLDKTDLQRYIRNRAAL